MTHTLHHCTDAGCNVCRGGLAMCTVCGGAEASLPTDCPGVRMDGDVQDAVQADDIDFANGGWVALRPGAAVPS